MSNTRASGLPDQNFRPSLFAVSSADSQSVVVLEADPTTNRLLVSSTSAAEQQVGDVAGATDYGIPTLAIRDDALSALSDAEGDYVPLRVSSTGALHVTGGGGGTQYNIDDAAGATDTGSVLLVVRDDSLSTLTPADGDYVPLRVNSTGALHVTGGGGGTEYTEDSATPATITGTATLMERDDALSTVTPVEGDWIGLRGTAEGALWTQDFNSDAIKTAVELIDNTVATVSATDLLRVGIFDASDTQITSFGGGTQYTEGDTDATITGNAIMWEDTGDTLRPVSAAKPLPVDGSGVTQPVSASSLPLPTGAATAANQSTIIGHVDGIETLIGTTNSTLSTIDTDTGNISTKIDTIAGAVSGTEMQVDVLTMPTVTVNTHAVTQSGTWNVGTLTGSSVAHDAVDSGNPHKIGGRASSSAPTAVASGDRVNAYFDTNGRLAIFDGGTSITVDAAELTTLAGAVSGSEMQVDVVGSLPAGTNAIGKLAANSGVDIGDVDVTSIAAGTNAIGNVGIIPRTSGGLDIFRSIDIDESEEEIKSSAGQLFSISAFNTTAAPIYLKFYNATAASVTVGTTTPVLTFVVPANADSDGAGFIWNNDIGFAFSTAMTVAATTGVADSDTGAPSANACIVNIGYK